jgi:hypothetical protein
MATDHPGNWCALNARIDESNYRGSLASTNEWSKAMARMSVAEYAKARSADVRRIRYAISRGQIVCRDKIDPDQADATWGLIREYQDYSKRKNWRQHTSSWAASPRN